MDDIYTAWNFSVHFFYSRSLVSTAVLSYTLGLRHALDADHISVYGSQSNIIALPTKDSFIGNRSYDSKASRYWSESCHSGDLLFSGSFDVGLLPLCISRRIEPQNLH